MTFKGKVFGITRFGVSKMSNSTLMLASFEQTTDHLYEAAMHCRNDAIKGVSECIIMGNMIPVGTGMFKVIYDETLKSQPAHGLVVSAAESERGNELAFDDIEDIIKDSKFIIQQ
jgi:DNA-directed RNA polymerase III subunit RPC1